MSKLNAKAIQLGVFFTSIFPILLGAFFHGEIHAPGAQTWLEPLVVVVTYMSFTSGILLVLWFGKESRILNLSVVFFLRYVLYIFISLNITKEQTVFEPLFKLFFNWDTLMELVIVVSVYVLVRTKERLGTKVS